MGLSLTTSIFALVMSNLHRPVSKRNTNTQSMGKQYINALTRSIVVLGLVAGSNSLGLSPLLAAPTAPNTKIDNQATGTFTDDEDTTPEKIVSNVVSITVAEVAGITVTAGTPSEAPATVADAGALQGTGTINAGDIAYFEFIITNAGNDPTQFFIPGIPNITGPATFDAATNPIEIISYNPTGTADIPVTVATPVPAAGQVTGPSTATGTDGLLGKNGIIPAGGSVKIRVPVKVDAAAAVNANISVQLGNTPSDAQNQIYSASTNNSDIYTQDNPDGTINGAIVETDGLPINGNNPDRRQEASATSSTTVIAEPISISGIVFEDVNYGGGAGRDLAIATGVGRPNAQVEIYDTNGNYLAKTLTDANGKYKFNQLNATNAFAANKSYYIRVVNNTVTSSRPGAVPTLLPVQTFRTEVSTGTVNPVTDRVGGENPSVADRGPVTSNATLNTTNFTFTAFNEEAGGQAASITPVTIGATAIAGVDFGYNFDTIVNTNDAGQGSLRQFVTNSNTLGNAGLTQQGLTTTGPIAAGQEVSIFMIPDGTARPGLSSTYASGLNGTGGNANTAVIALSSQLVITDSNTSIDARTQTKNVSNSNSGTVGTGGTVGTDGVALSLIPKPEIVLNFSPMPTVNGNLNPSGGGSNPIVIQGQNTALAGFAFYGYKISQGLGGLNKGMVWVAPNVTDSGKATLTQLFGGTLADGTKPPVNSLVGSGIQTSGGSEISNSYFAYLADATDFENINGTQAKFFNNELAFNGPQTTSTNDMSGLYADQLETGTGSKNIIISGNLIRNSNKINVSSAQGQGLQISNSTFVTVENNSFIDNNIFGINVSASDSLIQKNIVTGTKNGPGFTQGSGVIVYYGGTPLTGLRNRISQNSIYDNFKLGIDRQIDGVTPNDGLLSATEPNNGMDYPIITSSSISGNTLTVKGYVGTPANSSTFAGATLEFFVGAADTNDKGKVFASDPATTAKLHAEGQTYLGTCTADSNGKFNCSMTVPTGTDPRTITSTATDAAGNTSEFSASVSNPNVLLVKRITAINGITNTTSGDNLAGYIQEESNPYDDNVIETALAPSNNFPTPDTTYWPNTTGKTSSNFLLGGINGGNIKPKDTIEYTIYFLSTGDSPAENVMFCDRVPSNTTFFPTAFNTSLNPPAPGGTNDSRGILALINGTTASYTNVGDGDAARYVPAGTVPKDANNNIINCGGANDNGAVVFNLGTIPNAAAPNTPGSYGFVRFQGRVK